MGYGSHRSATSAEPTKLNPPSSQAICRASKRGTRTMATLWRLICCWENQQISFFPTPYYMEIYTIHSTIHIHYMGTHWYHNLGPRLLPEIHFCCMEWEIMEKWNICEFHVFTSTRQKKHQRNCRMILWWMALFQDIPGWWNKIYSDWRHVIKWFLWESSDMKRFSQKHKGIGFGSIWVLH